MTATPSPNPTNLLMLAALGIGVYWFMTRSGGGSPQALIYPTPAQNQQAYGADTSKVMKYQLLGGLLNKGLDFFGQRAAGQNPYSLATGYNGGSFGTVDLNSKWGVQASNDGFAYNPATGSASDSIYSLI